MSKTDAAMLLVLVAVAVLIAVTVIRSLQESADAKHREEERRLYQERKQQQELHHLLGRVERYFPFVKPYLKPHLEQGLNVAEALPKALADVPGIVIGTTQFDLPAVLAHAERNKHLWIISRSGFGKTSILTRIVAQDVLEGRGFMACSPEHEWFRDFVLGIIPESRAEQVVYFAPGRDCPLTLNFLQVEEGDDPSRVAADLAIVLRRATGEEHFGVRTGPIADNALRALVGKPGATLLSIVRFFRDERYREEILGSGCDPYVVDFFRHTYPRLPRGSELPLLYRLDQFLGRRSIRQCLCNPVSSFSIRRVLAENLILLVDLGNLDEDTQRLLGGLFMAKAQLAAFRREAVPESQRTMFPIIIDEFQVSAVASEAALRTMLSRGRRMGCALCVANQHPGQLPKALRDELLGNISSLIVMNTDHADAAALSRELLHIPPGSDVPVPVPTEHIVTQRVGEGVCRFGSGAYALMVKMKQPIREQAQERGERIRRVSWATHGIPAALALEQGPGTTSLALRSSTPGASAEPMLPSVSDLSEVELRYLQAVVENPGQASAEYGKLVGLNGTRAAAVRKKLVERGFVREHRLARKAAGKPALILEPLEPARQAVGAAAKEPSP